MNSPQSMQPLVLTGDELNILARLESPAFEIVAFSDRSPAKITANEDSALAMTYGTDAVVVAVADGAGGLPAGQRASNTAVAALRNALEQAAREKVLLRTAILNGIEAANAAVMALSNGSATTLTVVGADEDSARSFHVGDSSALLIGQRGKLKFQTIAHSPTGFAVEAGFLEETEALFHSERHVVSNFLGDSEMRIDVGASTRFAQFDTLVVASDGLTDNVRVDEITEAVRKGPITSALQRLTLEARQRMLGADSGQPCKPDDLTVLLMRRRRPAKKKASEAAD
ncbi:MAG: serine/threonine protein phosphatase [Chromatiales bacterium]|jgi:serine/threonine protein phosphatase PrpC|nr:protein phosphatase 2C domain-containing protein [Chromatiales bacterium]MDH4014945.1 protein phosphatase 2C domain-containing protein [Chromatiales bacterium]PLX55738.1 MAG: serine/threonine protein phosphatase [Chromatiales bacterium]